MTINSLWSNTTATEEKREKATVGCFPRTELCKENECELTAIVLGYCEHTYALSPSSHPTPALRTKFILLCSESFTVKKTVTLKTVLKIQEKNKTSHSTSTLKTVPAR